MLFNSLTFVLFFFITILFYYKSTHKKQNIVLLIASYIFYGWWDFRLLSLIWFTTAANFYCANLIFNTENKQHRINFLVISLFVNLGTLAFFKYFNFFSQSAIQFFNIFGITMDFPSLNIILPVGISFYTFQAMGYVIDIYKKQTVPCSKFLDFALYISFFPQLVAGPIERAKNLIPQITNHRKLDANKILDGIWLIIIGYVKKLVIADKLSQVANMGFISENPNFSGFEGLIFLYAFSFQIYGDFAGYSDIARGVSKVLGFELINNFKKPYLVSNASKFWKNWHISLSEWLQNYLYIPLGGNRKGYLRTYFNLMVTMLLGGLWHGAHWAFIIWGGYHGLLLCANRLWTAVFRDRISTQLEFVSLLKAVSFLKGVLFFHLTVLGWLFFRAGSVDSSINEIHFIFNYLSATFSSVSIGNAAPWFNVIFLLGGLSLFFQYKNTEMESFHKWSTKKQVLSFVSCILLIIVFGVFDEAAFIYFQF